MGYVMVYNLTERKKKTYRRNRKINRRKKKGIAKIIKIQKNLPKRTIYKTDLWISKKIYRRWIEIMGNIKEKTLRIRKWNRKLKKV